MKTVMIIGVCWETRYFGRCKTIKIFDSFQTFTDFLLTEAHNAYRLSARGNKEIKTLLVLSRAVLD